MRKTFVQDNGDAQVSSDVKVVSFAVIRRMAIALCAKQGLSTKCNEFMHFYREGATNLYNTKVK